MNGLDGKVVVVAGGATGIGAAASRRLASEGAHVLVGDLNMKGAEKTVAEITASGQDAVAFEFDISDEHSCAALIAHAKERWGKVNGLVNNAADLSHENLGRDHDSDVVTVPNDVIERTLKVNLVGYIFTSRYAIPAMLEAGGGSIVHLTSGVVAGFPNYAAYGAAKGGVLSLSRHIATRWGKERVRSNSVDPGCTLTEQQLENNTDEHRDFVFTNLRSDRFGEPEEIAAAVAFLLSDDGRWINGQTYVVSSHPQDVAAV